MSEKKKPARSELLGTSAVVLTRRGKPIAFVEIPHELVALLPREEPTELFERADIENMRAAAALRKANRLN